MIGSMLGLLMTDENCHHLSASGCGILPPKGSGKFAAADFSAGGDGTARDPAALFLST